MNFHRPRKSNKSQRMKKPAAAGKNADVDPLIALEYEPEIAHQIDPPPDWILEI